MKGVILARYLTRLFAVRFLGALAGFAALIEVLDLFDVAGEILQRGEGLGGIAHYAALRLPVILVDVVPFAALIGALFTFMGLASKSEVIALRALGLPARGVVFFLAPVALLVGGAHLLASNFVAPPAESALRDWMLRTEAPDAPAEEPEHWLRSGQILMGFGAASPDGSELRQVLIYERDADGRLQRRIAAERAVYQDPQWLLQRVSVNDDDGGRRDESELGYDPGLTPSDILELSQPVEHLSLAQLREGASGGPTGARSQAFFRTRLMTTWSFLAIPAIMIAIAAPVAFASLRRRTVGLQAAYGLAGGLMFILVAGILRTLGESGALPAAAAAFAAPILAAFLAAARLHRVER